MSNVIEFNDRTMQWSFKVAGITFEGRRKKAIGIKQGDAIYLVPEPKNLHDKNAIAVYRRDILSLHMSEAGTRNQRIDKSVVAQAAANKAQIGYVPKEIAASLQKILRSCDAYEANVQEVFLDKMGTPNKILGVRISATTYYDDCIVEDATD